MKEALEGTPSKKFCSFISSEITSASNRRKIIMFYFSHLSGIVSVNISSLRYNKCEYLKLERFK